MTTTEVFWAPAAVKQAEPKSPFLGNRIGILAILALLLSPARAADGDWKWESSVGAMAMMAPKYEGSAAYEPYYLPMTSLAYGPFFASASQGLGMYIPVNESRSLIFSPALRWRAKRNLGPSLGTIEYIESIRPTASLNTIVKLDPIMFNFRITNGLADSDRGASFNLGITWQDDISEKTHLTLYATAIYGSRQYNQTYFGITEFESAKYGYDVYRPAAGLKSLDIGAMLKYSLTAHVSINLLAEALQMTGPAAKSPIVGAETQLLLGLGTSYKF